MSETSNPNNGQTQIGIDYRKYVRINPESTKVIANYPYQTDLPSITIDVLEIQERVKRAIDNYTQIVLRNFPGVDQSIIQNLLHSVLDEILPHLHKSSDEIIMRYQETGKFEGYDHPAIEAIIEKHLLDANQGTRTIMQKFMRAVGTPMHEIWGQHKYAETEGGVVAKNVHTTVSRVSNVVAAGMFMEGISAVFNPILAGVASVSIYTVLQMINEYTNEAEHTTKEKQNPIKIYTKWQTMLLAKAMPLAITVIGLAGMNTNKLHERYIDQESLRMRNLIEKGENDRTHNQTYLNRNQLLQDLENRESRLTKLANDNPNPSDNVHNRAISELFGSDDKNPDKGSVRSQVKEFQNQIVSEAKFNKDLLDEFATKPHAKFLIDHADIIFGNNKAKDDYIRAIEDYNKLSSGERISNGLGYIKDKVTTGDLTDEVIVKFWVAALIEVLSVITLVHVQSRQDSRRIVTNRDTQGSAGHVVEGGLSLMRQVVEINDYNELTSDENNQYKPVVINKVEKNELSRKLDSLNPFSEKHTHQAPSFTSLINSRTIQKKIVESFRIGDNTAFNLMMEDVARGVLSPIPTEKEKLKRGFVDQVKSALGQKVDNKKELVEKISHDVAQEKNLRYLINLPYKMSGEIQEHILAPGDQDLLHLATDLNTIIANNKPSNGEDYQSLLSELKKIDKKQDYLQMMKNLQDIISEANDVIDKNGASRDRQDLKNEFKDQVRNTQKQYDDGEGYDSGQKGRLQDIAKQHETTELGTNLNDIRMGYAINFLVQTLRDKSITPVNLGQIVTALKSGNIGLVDIDKSKAKRTKADQQSIHLSSPYEPHVYKVVGQMSALASKYANLKYGWNNGKLDKFRNELAQVLNSYNLRS